MELLLKVASTYRQKGGVSYSERKYKVMEFSRETQGQWILGNSVSEAVDRYTYLGLEVSKQGIGGEIINYAGDSVAHGATLSGHTLRILMRDP